MGAGHLKSGRLRMRGNSLSYEIFRGVNCGGSLLFKDWSGDRFRSPF